MAVETASHISDLVPSNIDATTDFWEGGSHVNITKQVLVTDFGNIDAAVTSDSADLNRCDITTEGVTENSKVLTCSSSGTISVSGKTWTDLGSVTTCDINGGTLDGVTISGSTINGTIGGTPASGTFTTLTANTSFVLNGSTALTSVDTDLTAVSASHDTMTTAKAAKDYVDAEITTVNATISGLTDSDSVTLNADIADVSTAATVWIPISKTGTVTRMDTVLGGAISGADATISLQTSGGSAMASVVIANSGSGAGDVDSTTSITNASVTAGTAVKVLTDGLSTGTQSVRVAILIE